MPAEQEKGAQIRALIEELQARERGGDAARAAEVKAELKRLGHEASAPAARAARRKA